MPRLIAVSGSNEKDENLTKAVLEKAERVGLLIARKGGILLCGGLGGIMEACSRGAKAAGGITVGILPFGKEGANPYIDIPIPTNMGYFRNSILIAAADSVIGICGRWGTMNEISMGIALGKPTVLLRGTGGFAQIADTDAFRTSLRRMPRFADSPEEAVEIAFSP